MEKELKLHLSPLFVIFILISVSWFITKTPWYQFVYLFFGFLWGSFALDLDHLIYWLYLRPNLEESRLAQVALQKKDFGSLLKLLETTHKNHTSLIFHHFFFQIVLLLISFFVFTSSTNIFAKSFLLALNIHLFVDEYHDYLHDKIHLQDWLFAREESQLSVNYLSYYLGIVAILNLVFSYLLLRSFL
ncbi:MAG TPA: hypothetical protein PK639_02995 [Candidatus Woesebacteria bacterium]|nr:hypothetical protein [Candidatus Woesebacteria bacterium]